jgi:hypothetical protein
MPASVNTHQLRRLDYVARLSKALTDVVAEMAALPRIIEKGNQPNCRRPILKRLAKHFM